MGQLGYMGAKEREGVKVLMSPLWFLAVDNDVLIKKNAGPISRGGLGTKSG